MLRACSPVRHSQDPVFELKVTVSHWESLGRSLTFHLAAVGGQLCGLRLEAGKQVGRLVGSPGFDVGGTDADGAKVVVVFGGELVTPTPGREKSEQTLGFWSEQLRMRWCNLLKGRR